MILKMHLRSLAVLVCGLLLSFNAKAAGASSTPSGDETGVRTFAAKGVVQAISPDEQTVVIQHDAISNYMSAMTMPFTVRERAALANLHPGDEVSFQLHVTATTSWIDRIEKIGTGAPPIHKKPADYEPATAVNTLPGNPLLYCKFTNELGQAVSLNDFHGQALGVTFFYTRCPLPNFCPRLSKNFQEASQKLEAMPNAPTNWHFLSITFDPEFDTPAMLKSYGESYHYDPKHWSFLTGSPEQIAELARSCGVEYAPSGGTINHNFRTLIVNATGHLQMVFPFTGDYSEGIVDQILKAAAVTNQPAQK
jgi:protein SCO1